MKDKSQIRTLGSIERLDPALDAIVPKDAVMEILGEGYAWSEGPLWIRNGNFLIFSDIPPNRIMKWKEGEGVTTYLEKSGYLGSIPRPGFVPPDEPGSNGLTLDPQGRLVLCQHGNRQVARMKADLNNPKAEYETLADNYEGKKLNSPNDVCFHSDGSMYFTDPPYGLTKKENDPDKQLDFQGVYRVDPAGKITLLTKELSRPNGLAFSPDYKTLYVANSDPARAIWMAYDVQSDGSIANGRVFFDATDRVPTMKGLPDGLKVDKQGNVFATAPGGVMIFNAEGKLLGTLATGQPTSNCGFGEDGKTLFITANMYVVRIRLNTVGCGF